MDIVSLFSGCGGLDLGFERQGFRVIWANEYDKTIQNTYCLNHAETFLECSSITEVASKQVPDCLGIIGAPPCQSWSASGAKRGIADPRGQLFYEYLRIVRDKQPLFFLAENVKGLLSHKEAFSGIVGSMEDMGYTVSHKLLNAHDYGVPQSRERVIFVGYRRDLGKRFMFPKPLGDRPTLECIRNLSSDQDYLNDTFSPMYLSRNRVRRWDEPSFTILATGRAIPLHPDSHMTKVFKDEWELTEGYPNRRLSVRECARIQTFPDSFTFLYKNINNGYKMVGNAVPVNLASCLAKQILADLTS